MGRVIRSRWNDAEDDPGYVPGSEDYEYDRARQEKDEAEAEQREHDLMVQEAFKVHHGLPVVRAFSDADLDPHLFTIRVIDAFFQKILQGDEL